MPKRTRWESIRTRNDAGGDLSLGCALRRRSGDMYLGKLDAEITRELIASNVGYLIFHALGATE